VSADPAAAEPDESELHEPAGSGAVSALVPVGVVLTGVVLTGVVLAGVVVVVWLVVVLVESGLDAVVVVVVLESVLGVLGVLEDGCVVAVEDEEVEDVAGVLLVVVPVAGQPVVAVVCVLAGADPASTVASV